MNTVAAVIRSSRRRGATDPRAVAGGGEIMVTQADKSILKEFVVDRAQGYGVTRLREWSLSVSDVTPATEMTASYRRSSPDGPFIAAHLIWIERSPIQRDGKYADYVDRFRREVTLVDAGIGDPPGDEAFTLAGFRAPSGAWINDK